MTLLGDFNSLRELGGAWRLTEDEVRTGVFKHGDRRRVGEAEGLFLDRTIDYEPVELTSRVDTDEVARAPKSGWSGPLTKTMPSMWRSRRT